VRGRVLALALLSLLALPGQSLGQGAPAEAVAERLGGADDAEQVLGFARFLDQQGDHARAAGEYRRYLFLRPGAAGADSIYYCMVRALFRADEYPLCDQLLTEFPGRFPGSRLRPELPLFRSIVALQAGDVSGALALAGDPAIPSTGLKHLVMAMGRLRLGDLEGARAWACEPPAPGADDAAGPGPGAGRSLGRLCHVIQSEGVLPRRSGGVAGCLSALVPGAGKAYCGKWADGLNSLLIVGLAAWQAADGFDEDGARSAKGWVFGTVGAVFYLGNVYGSTIAADLYNRDALDGFLARIRIDVSLP
jgi:hypothetical protein